MGPVRNTRCWLTVFSGIVVFLLCWFLFFFFSLCSGSRHGGFWRRLRVLHELLYRVSVFVSVTHTSHILLAHSLTKKPLLMCVSPRRLTNTPDIKYYHFYSYRSFWTILRFNKTDFLVTLEWISCLFWSYRTHLKKKKGNSIIICCHPEECVCDFPFESASCQDFRKLFLTHLACT